MTTAEYRKADAVNFSSLKHILKSPAHYKAAIEEKREETKAMILGTLTHAVALEGKRLLEIAAIKPEGLSLATKEGKEWKLLAEDKPIVSDQEAKDIWGMAQSIKDNPYAAHLLFQCQHRETPLFAELQGVPCKALLDAHGTDGEEWIIVDLKTTDDASPDAFAKKVAHFDYDFQAAYYSAILAKAEQIETPPFWFWIAVEKQSPYTCVVYSANEWTTGGEDKMIRALDLYKECKAKNEWPQPYSGLQQLPKPKWA